MVMRSVSSSCGCVVGRPVHLLPCPLWFMSLHPCTPVVAIFTCVKFTRAINSSCARLRQPGTPQA